MAITQERAEARPRADRAVGHARGPRLSTVFTWLFAVGGLAVGIRQLHDNSLMWHVRTGRLILDHGIPRRDPYSFTAAGSKWVAQSWLAELLYGVINRVGGAFGLRLLGAAIGFAIGCLLFRITWRCAKDRIRAGALTILAMAVLLNVWSTRPLIFGILAMLVLVVIVELPDTWIARHALVSLPILMWLWANVHGTFAIGFGYLVVHLVGQALEGHPPTLGRERVLFRGALLAAGVTLLNPYGFDLVLFPVRLMARGGVLRDVAEWQSPNFRELGGQLFGAFLVCTLVILARKRVGARDLLITVIFMLLGLWAIRNVGLAVIAIVPILARLVRNDAPRADARHSMHRTMLAMAVLALSLCVVHAAGEPDWNLDRYPVAAFDAVQAQHLEGRRLLTTDSWGGYLIAVAWPQQKVFFDDRYDMYPLAINQDYDTLARVKPGWLETLDRHHIDVVMWRSESALVQALAQRPDWVRIHTDAVATVYARRSVLTSSSA